MHAKVQQVKVGRYLRELGRPPLDNAGGRSHQGDVLSLPLPYVRPLLSRSRMCLGRHCRGHQVHVSRLGGCPHMCPWVGPHAPSFGRKALGAAQPCGVSLTTRGIDAASVQYDRLTLVARVAGPLCLAGDPLLDCLPASLSSVASMAPGDVCHGPRCSLAGLGPTALGYCPCCWPGESAGSPQCTRPMGCRFLPVPRPPYLCTCVLCPGPLGSCSAICSLGALLCLCGVVGHLAPVHRCARSVCCFACAVSLATLLLFTGVPSRCVACVCGVLGVLAPVHRCACLVCCFACAVSWATWLSFTGVPARRVLLRVQCPGPLGFCSLVCLLGVLCCFGGVLGHLAPVQRCARSACCVACAVSWASWPLFTGVPARCVVVCLWCPGPLDLCSPVCLLIALLCLCCVLGHLTPVHQCARSLRCFACAVSCATWLLFTGVPARCVACVCGVLGHLALVYQCACSVCCFARAVSWATWLLFTGVSARCVALRVRCPGPVGSCSPVCQLRVLFCLCGVLGHLSPVHRCARLVSCFACAVFWATWLSFTSVPARCVALRVRWPGPLGSCSPVCSLGVLCCGLLMRGVAAGRSLVHPDSGYS